MIKLLILLVLLVGCSRSLPQVTHEPADQPDQTVLVTVLQAWNARNDLPDIVEEARENFLGILVTDAATNDGFRARCRVCGPSNVDPHCTRGWGTKNTIIRGGACPVTYDRCSGPFCGLFVEHARLIVIAPRQTERRNVMVTNTEGVVLSIQTEEEWQRYLAVWPAHRQRLIVHEAVHWAGGLAGVGMDNAHRNPAMWCLDQNGTYVACRADTGVEGAARTLLTQ